MTGSEEQSSSFIDQFGSDLSVGSNKTDESSEEQAHNTPTNKEETTHNTEEGQNSDSAKSDRTESQESIKDRENVLMYLPSDLRSELDIQFDELNAQHKRKHGEGLEKNRDYYPAVIQAGLTGKDLEEILDI